MTLHVTPHDPTIMVLSDLCYATCTRDHSVILLEYILVILLSPCMILYCVYFDHFPHVASVHSRYKKGSGLVGLISS